MEFLNILIGVAGLIVMIFVPLIIYLWQKKRRLIYWNVISSSSLSSFLVSDKLKVLVIFDNKSLKDASLIRLKIWNAGNKEVKEYITPIKFTFQTEAKILKAEVEDMNPINLVEKKEDIVAFTSEWVELKRLILNPKDSVTLKVLIDTLFKDEVKQLGRIVGGVVRRPGKTLKEHLKSEVGRIRTKFIVFFGAILAILGFIYSIFLFYKNNNLDNTSFIIVAAIA